MASSKNVFVKYCFLMIAVVLSQIFLTSWENSEDKNSDEILDDKKQAHYDKQNQINFESLCQKLDILRIEKSPDWKKFEPNKISYIQKENLLIHYNKHQLPGINEFYLLFNFKVEHFIPGFEGGILEWKG